MDDNIDMEESDDENILEQVEPKRITALADFLKGRLLGNANPSVGLTRSLIFSVCKFFGSSIHPILYSLRRDGHLLVDVPNETLVDKFYRPPTDYAASPPGSEHLPHNCHTTLTRVGLVPSGAVPPQVTGSPSGVQPLLARSAVHSGTPVVDQPATCKRHHSWAFYA